MTVSTVTTLRTRLAAIPPHPKIFVASLAVVGLLIVIARAIWPVAAVQDFVERYPGMTNAAQPTGTPGWAAALHMANILITVLIARSGLAIRLSQRPAAHWTRRGKSRSGKKPTTITIEEWFHVAIDLVWVGLGIAFVTLLMISGRWVRLVPTTWDIFPNAASVALQYFAFHWPTGHGWAAYNALQILGYFILVFVLAPLAILTGFRLSALWPKNSRLNRLYPIDRARTLHYPVMVTFVIVIAMHVGLVIATGAVRNLNHMFAIRDDDSPLGLFIALAVIAIGVAVWFAVRPSLLKPLGALFGKVTR